MNSRLSDFPTLEELSELHTVGDWIRFCASQLERAHCYYGHGFADPLSEARFLVLRGLQLAWNLPDQYLSAALTSTESTRIHALLRARCVERVPTAYLLEEAWFYGEAFYVNRQVLIPRSPLAELIGRRFSPWLGQSPTRMLDLCTGSGCIGIALAREFPKAHIDISDVSAAALAVASENLVNKQLEHRVGVLQSDLFDSLPQTEYDLIVTNPPYVDAEDFAEMPEEFYHEPALALAAGTDGLELMRRILAQAPGFMAAEGWLVGEVGNSAAALLTAFPDVPFIWPELKQGGQGVFVISRDELLRCHDALA